METKDCQLVLIKNKTKEYKKDMIVEYVCYSIDRKTDRAIGQIKNIFGRDSYVLSNQQYYSSSDLKPILLYVVSNDEIKLGDSFIDLEDIYDYYGEVMVAGDSVKLQTINELKQNFKKIIAFPSQIGYAKDMRHDENSCHLCVPVEPYELTEIMDNKGNCKIELKDGTPKLVNNKITFIFH